MMPVRISLKDSLLMLLGGLSCAIGVAFLVNFLLSGPKLGPHYDFLLNYKKPVVAREILIINTDEYIEGSDFFTVLMTLTEMEASNLVLTGRLSPSATPITVTEADIRRRFAEEYSLVGSNIRNLFEGIRMGTVAPAQAPNFVERLVELTERGRDRLITALIDRDEDLLRSVAVFGNFVDAYTRPELDKDGKLRRVNIDNPVYLHLKNRYAVSQVESSANGQVLWLRGHDRKDMDILLDNDGNIITPGISSFRRIDIELFNDYEEAGIAMLEALAQAVELGIFSKTPPEKIPLFLGEYSYVLLEELIKTPDSNNRMAWITARANYFKSLEDFFDSFIDVQLISGLEEQIADTDSSNRRQITSLINRRDELRESSVLMREIYGKLFFTREKLSEELAMSLCIMGPQYNAEYSALLANAIITGSHVKPISDRFTLFWSISALLVVLIFIFMLRPSMLLGLGLPLSFLATGAFSCLFLFLSFWIDPLIILSSSLTGTLIMFLIKTVYLSYRTRSFRTAYRTAVPKNILQGLIETGRPELSEINVSYAAVIAIKDMSLFNREDNEKSKESSKIKKNFYSTARRILFNAGAVIAGYEGDTILACFGSPLELKPTLTTYKYSEDGKPIKTYYPVDKACALVRQLLKNEKITWRFGIDSGECVFSWSPETGFSVSGSPAVRARVLVSRTTRYRLRALITKSIQEKIDLEPPDTTIRNWADEPVKQKIGVLYNESDPIYELN